MSKQTLKAGLLSPAILAVSLVVSSVAQAEVSVSGTSEIQTQSHPTEVQSHLLVQVPVNLHSGQIGPQSGSGSVQVSDFNTKENTNSSPSSQNTDQLNQYFREGRRSGSPKKQQVTSVSQLSDVQPTDWAFQALQSLVERYGCIAGYPDGTYKGNRALTRYEFAAGVNACLERVNELIDAATADLVTREDLAILQRLMEEFAAELAALRGRVTVLEARAAELEANQFSTTTKLNGEAIFFIGDTFGDRAQYTVAGGPNVDESDDPTQSIFGYRARLTFDTSFSGEDLLRTRLQALNVSNFSDQNLTNTVMTGIDPNGGDGDFILDDLYYRFPINNGKGKVYFGAKSLGLDDILIPLSPFPGTGGGQASFFGSYNPVTFRGPEGTGLGLQYILNDSITLALGYLASDGDAPDASEGRGLFNGSHSAFFQVLYEPTLNFGIGLDYNRRYFREDNVFVSGGVVGSFLANRPFGNNATSTDNLGVQTHWRVARHFEVGGWFGATWADEKSSSGDDLDATILNFAVTFAFPDLLKEGDLGGLLFGMQPKVVYHTIDRLEEDKTGIHIEAFYRFQFSENISVVPGIFIITDPEHTDENDTIVVTTLRTTFRF